MMTIVAMPRAEEGIENPPDEESRRFDTKRKNKKVSNQEWQSPTDEDSRIAKMKDGTTHLAYKAEHVIAAERAARVLSGGSRYHRIVEIDLTETVEDEDPSDANNGRGAV